MSDSVSLLQYISEAGLGSIGRYLVGELSISTDAIVFEIVKFCWGVRSRSILVNCLSHSGELDRRPLVETTDSYTFSAPLKKK